MMKYNRSTVTVYASASDEPSKAMSQSNPYLQSDKDRIANIGKVYKSNNDYAGKMPAFDRLNDKQKEAILAATNSPSLQDTAIACPSNFSEATTSLSNPPCKASDIMFLISPKVKLISSYGCAMWPNAPPSKIISSASLINFSNTN